MDLVEANAAAVDTRAAPFARRVDEWQLMRDFMAGARQLKTTSRIAPLSTDWDNEMKQTYVERAYLFNATEISVDGFAGMITVKAPTLDVPNDMTDIASDITGKGHDVAGLAALCADELMTVGAVGLLADHPPSPNGVTVAQAAALGLRPMVVTYPVETVLEVRTERKGGKTHVTRVRLSEDVIKPWGRWGERIYKRVRVLELVDGLYQQVVFDRNDKGEWIEEPPIFPLANNQRMTEIPFQLLTANGSAYEPPRPPLHTLAEANLAHLQNSALHEHGLAFCAQPVRFFAGMSAPDGPVPMIGSSIAVFSTDPNAKASIVEASADIVGAVVNAMKDKRADMAILGARFLAADGAAQIAENTARLNKSGDTASLSKITNAIEYGVIAALRWCAGFMGSTADAIRFQMSRDYMPVRMSPLELQALVATFQANLLPLSDFYANLVQGEIVAPREGGADDYREELETEAPGVVAVGNVV